MNSPFCCIFAELCTFSLFTLTHNYMSPRSAIIVFCLLLSSALLTGFGSYQLTAHNVQLDLNQALQEALAQQQGKQIVATDTIRDFRNCISISELKDQACLSFNMTDDEHVDVSWSVKRNVATIFALSNQKYSLSLTAVAVLWALFSARYFRKREALMLAQHFVTIGNLRFDPEQRRFLSGTNEVKFTPMQQQLMEMFFAEDTHCLHQSDICQALWPKKDDANESLYTLIRRLKAVIHKSTDLDIEAERGRGYRLIKK